VYALGCVLYQMLVGDPPFIGSTAQAIVAKVMTEKPSPPSCLRETIPAAVEAATLTALAKLPADRFATAAEFAAALAVPSGPAVASRVEPPVPGPRWSLRSPVPWAPAAGVADRYRVERILGAGSLGRPTSIDIVYPIGYTV
jgi:serine/threonine-protein kinase